MNSFERAQKILREMEVDAWIIACNEESDINSPFLLGVASHARHFIIIPKQGISTIIAVLMEGPMIEKSLRSVGIHAQIITYQTLSELNAHLAPFLKNQRIALNFGENMYSPTGTGFADYLRVGDYMEMQKLANHTQFVSAAPIISQLRSVKSANDIAELRETVKITEEILTDLPNWTKVGMTEKEVQAKIEYEFYKVGKPAFDSIIGWGPNSADPHYNTGHQKLHEGVLLVDVGIKGKRMCSDLTWTFWIGSKPADDFQKAYQVLLEAKIESFKYIKTGAPIARPDQAVREIMTKYGYDHEKVYTHGLGHSLGFECHDIGPRMNWKMPREIVLEENMVYSNEPGLYWQDKWGIRLEDDLVVRRDGPEILSKIPKDPPLI